MEATREIKITTGYEFNNKSESVFIRFVFCYCWMNVCVFVWPSLSSISGRIMQLSKLNKPWARNVWVATTRLSHFSSPKIVFFSQNFFSQFFVSSWNYHLTVKGVTNLIQWIFFCFLSLSTSYKLWIDFFPSKSKEEEKEKKKGFFVNQGIRIWFIFIFFHPKHSPHCVCGKLCWDSTKPKPKQMEFKYFIVFCRFHIWCKRERYMLSRTNFIQIGKGIRLLRKTKIKKREENREESIKQDFVNFSFYSHCKTKRK